jgi:methionyl aminopeptidase
VSDAAIWISATGRSDGYRRITETGVEILTRPPAASSASKKKKKKSGAKANGSATNGNGTDSGAQTPTTEVAVGVEGLVVDGPE